ncbi:MAG: O-methyltransferase [Planctomycetota bacterium]|jgi:caffeoyl-CoA O-methyltransferase
MEMTDERWRYTNEYSREVFGQQDRHLAGLMAEATAAGLPDIAVSADVGRLLMIVTTMTRAKLALEVGTLGGYSGIWIARGLAAGGRLITVEREPDHAAFAQRQFERAGVSDRVELRVGEALEVLPRLAGELGPGSVDVVFIDAEKTEYAAYWQVIRPLVAVGGVVLADNVLGTGSEWIDQQDQPQPRAVDRFNRLVAGDDAFEAVTVPLRQGVLMARRFF